MATLYQWVRSQIPFLETNRKMRLVLQWQMGPLKETTEAHRSFKPIPYFWRWMSFTCLAVSLFLLYMVLGSDDMAFRAQSSLKLLLLRRTSVAVISADPVAKTTQPISDQANHAPTTFTQVNESSISPAPKPSPELVADIHQVTTPADTKLENYCKGRRIFIYKLPEELNVQLVKNCSNVRNWWNMCQDLSNDGLGEQLNLPEGDPMATVLQPPEAWFRTEQFTLELLFHERLKISPCLTEDAQQASLFYIPFYHTLDLIRNLWSPSDALRDRLIPKFMSYLTNHPLWQLHQGRRHVLVLGRIIWDVKRGVDETGWGSSLLAHREIWNVTKLLIERDPWSTEMVAVPYPTSFHPASESVLLGWQATLRSSKRSTFVSFAGAGRGNRTAGKLRDELFHQCTNSTKCKVLVCTNWLCVQNPQTILMLAFESVFCIQPPGDSPTRKGIFDSLIAGCIPVLFYDTQAVKQYLWHLPGNGSAYSALLPGDDVEKSQYDVIDHLSRIPQAQIAEMQEQIVQLLPQLVYRNAKTSGEYTHKDAFDVAIDSLFQRFQDEDERRQQ